MQTRSSVGARLAIAVALTTACAGLTTACGGGGGGASDAAPPVDGMGPPDATGENRCLPPELVDLDDPAIGGFIGNSIEYSASIVAGPGQLEPQAGCVTGVTTNERVHKVAITERSLVEAVVTADMIQPVVYLRSACAEQNTELACGIGATSADVPAGTTVFIVVDAGPLSALLPQPYRLVVSVTPLRATGDACDPTQQLNVCESGTVCSVAGGGAPVCAAPLGGPVLTALQARPRDGGGPVVVVYATGSDPDGDVVSLRGAFRNAAGQDMDVDGDGLVDVLDFPAYALSGQTVIDGRVHFDIGSNMIFNAIDSMRFALVDSAGNVSAERTATLVRAPVLGGPTDPCGTDPNFCGGELSCPLMSCVVPPDTQSACDAADTAPAIGSGITMVTIAMGGVDAFQGTCYFDPGFGGEQVRRLTVPGPAHVRLDIRTDASPSDPLLDTYVYLRTSCVDPTTELGCDDDIGGNDYRSRLLLLDVAPGTYYVVIDGSSAYDGMYLPYGPVGVNVIMTDLKNPGDACTPGADLCTSGYSCHDPLGGAAGTCTAIAAICGAAPALVPGVAFTGTIGRTEANLIDFACGLNAGLPEKYHLLTLTQKSDVTASTDGPGTDFDSALAILDGCGYPPAVLACDDDITSTNWRSSITTTLPAGLYAVVVDMSTTGNTDGSAEAPDPASYSLLVTTLPVLAVGELCDPSGVLNRCDTGLTCTGTPATCQ